MPSPRVSKVANLHKQIFSGGTADYLRTEQLAIKSSMCMQINALIKEKLQEKICSHGVHACKCLTFLAMYEI